MTQRIRHSNRPSKQGLRALLDDTRGAVLTEYVVLMGAFGILVATAIAYAGWGLVTKFEVARFILMLPIP